MTNAQTPPHNHVNIGSAPEQTRSRSARSGYLTRRSDEACWHVIIRTASAVGRISIGTTDEGQARAIAATIQADADAGRFALDTTPTDERTRILLEVIEQLATRRRRRGTSSATKAGNGQSEILKQGSRIA